MRGRIGGFHLNDSMRESEREIGIKVAAAAAAAVYLARSLARDISFGYGQIQRSVTTTGAAAERVHPYTGYVYIAV